MGVEFRLLGPLEVLVERRAVALGGLKQRALLALLLLHANEVVTVDRALEAIWRDVELRAARRSLQVYVSSLRKALGTAAGALETRPGGYALAVAEEDLDVTRFERLVLEGRRAAEEADAARAASIFQEALALWRGPALAELRYEDFAQTEIERLEELRLGAVEQRIEADLALGGHAELVPELEALVVEHPLRERFRGQLMLAHYRSGRQADALAEYRDAQRLLSEELALEPSRELKDLEAAILRQDPALAVEPIEWRRRRRLPAPATALVGRRAEVLGVSELLRGDGRLITLTGPGGTGKTRVAIQTAHELADAFPDGVVFVGLAALRDPELVAVEIAAALGIEDGPRPAVETLGEHLQERTALLVIDNFEQVEVAAPELGRLLSAAPGLRLLVTSRHALRLYGEHEFPIPPLPDEDAVELFVARARAASPAFRSSGAVSELCAYLDRLPLAIELVAARIRELSPEEMLNTLPRRLELASHGPRDVPERQQTLWGAIGWSYDLLSATEQAAFAGLAVFAAGCTVEAARAVCDADSELLAGLVEKSLLFRSDNRASMLETVREYARERFADLAEASAVERRHADYFLSLVLAGEELRLDSGEVEWLDRLEGERENLAVALAFWLEHEPEEGARLANGAFRFWYGRAHFEEGSRAFERVAERADAISPRRRGKAYGYRAAFAFGRRDLARAQELAEQALAVQRGLGDLDQISRVLVLLGTLQSEQGEHDEALVALEESVDLARRHGDPFGLNFALAHLVRATLYAEDYERTSSLGEEALASVRATGDAGNEFGLLGNLGIAALRVGRHADAASHFAAALGVASQLRHPMGMIENIEAIAGAAAAFTEPVAEPAARLLGAAEALAAAAGIQLEAIHIGIRAEALDRLRQELTRARLESYQQDGRELTLEAAAEQAAELAARLRSRA